MPPPTGAPHSPPVADGRKKPAVAMWRVWSEADEVRILEGLAAYAAAHGEEPRRSQLRAALDGCGLDKSEFTVTEIYEKVRRLRIKYANLRSAGGVPVPAGGDEARKYELSMAIWGDRPLNVPKKVGASRATNASANTNAAPRPGTRVRRGVEELQGLYPSLSLAVEGITDDESLRPMLKRAFQLISDEKARELDAKMKKQMAKEVQMTLNQSALRNQVLDVLIRSMD
ncbi:unnamed protein product [Miscanthus lutarioriparius]|uniref:Glabrous enhancer-binding protein-like DBD domain-containing protein n=1 Tax=Miscanthus lutarioriparius TaxID=422564 RepID=A0A811MCE2_9POAL|nr:unnamed protein product [Miscanthus lutarioriparius]